MKRSVDDQDWTKGRTHGKWGTLFIGMFAVPDIDILQIQQ